MGANVRYFDERPSNSWLVKAIIRFRKQLWSQNIEQYYSSIFSSLKNFNPDYLLVLRGEVLPALFLRDFKNKWPNCKMIFYNSDSFLNNPESLKIFELFDKSFTFDPKDAEIYNLNYLPLFYDDFYLTQSSEYTNRQFDLSFIGTLHSDRAMFIKKIIKQFPEHKAFIFFYTHGILGLIYHIIAWRHFSLHTLKNLHFKPLTTNETRDVFLNSKFVIDSEHPNQNGLTSRTIESLGARCKLITTNRNIKDEDFYSEINICIVDRLNPRISRDFINSDFMQFNEQISEKYSLTRWLKTLFEEE